MQVTNIEQTPQQEGCVLEGKVLCFSTESALYEVPVSELPSDNLSIYAKTINDNLELHSNALVMYKNYRSVDTSHVNRLHSLTKKQITQTYLEQSPLLQGTMHLPGGFLVSTAYNKTINPTTFDREKGERYLADDLDRQFDDRIWELEGYRLYRNLIVLDTLAGDAGLTRKESHVLCTLIANRAEAYRSRYLQGKVIVSTLDTKRFASRVETSYGELKYTAMVVHETLYYQLRAIIDSYIEKQ